jgi:hypothetical protein
MFVFFVAAAAKALALVALGVVWYARRRTTAPTTERRPVTVEAEEVAA